MERGQRDRKEKEKNRAPRMREVEAPAGKRALIGCLETIASG